MVTRAASWLLVATGLLSGSPTSGSTSMGPGLDETLLLGSEGGTATVNRISAMERTLSDYQELLEACLALPDPCPPPQRDKYANKIKNILERKHQTAG